MSDGAIDIKVDTSELDAYLAEITDPARLKKVVRKALRKGGMIIRDAIAERAPERPDLPSGTALPIGALKNDIIVRSSTAPDGREVCTVQAGALTDHVAGWVEFGHLMVKGGRRDKRTGRGKGKLINTYAGTVHVPAHPFFRPGEEASAGPAGEAIAESLSEDLLKENVTGGAESEAA